MKQRIFLSAFTLWTLSAVAQDSTTPHDSSFQLKDYRYRTPGFRALSFGFDLNGSLLNDVKENNSKQNLRNFGLSISNLQYFRTISTDKRLHISSISFSPSFQASSNGNNATTSKQRQLQSSLSWYRNEKFYKNNQWFLEAGNLFNYNAGTNRTKDTAIRQQANAHHLQNTLTLGFGKGRIENVQDAQMAMYILSDLQQQGLLNTPAQPQTVQELARLITAINNRRVFDSRRRRIFELTQIDSFLRSSGLVTDTDIRHFTTVNDNWALAFNPGRLSGAQWFIRLLPGAGFESNIYNRQETTAKYNTRHSKTKFTLAPMAGFEKFIPVNLKWQRNMGATLYWQQNWHSYNSKYDFNNQTSRQDSSEQSNQWHFRSYYGVGYYPNNRTQLTANLELEAIRWNYQKGNTRNFTQLKPALRLEADYFVSYQTRLFAQYHLSYWQNFFNKLTQDPVLLDKQQLRTSFSIGFSHILF